MTISGVIDKWGHNKVIAQLYVTIRNDTLTSIGSSDGLIKVRSTGNGKYKINAP